MSDVALDWFPALDRLVAAFRSLLDVLLHDTTGMDARTDVRHVLLLGWLAANVLASPVSWLWSRAIGAREDFRKIAGTNFGVAVVQVLLFTLLWYVIAWNQRTLDWTMFFFSLGTASLVVLWAFTVSWFRCFLYCAGQAAWSLLVFFLGGFIASEIGWPLL